MHSIVEFLRDNAFGTLVLINERGLSSHRRRYSRLRSASEAYPCDGADGSDSWTINELRDYRGSFAAVPIDVDSSLPTGLILTL